MKPQFFQIGQQKAKIAVRISYKIIHLFSEGLYSSPHKAIEELVSNSFDAGAENVQVIVPLDLGAKNASIAVIDDGVGMNEDGLKELWLIGVSNKRIPTKKPPKGRKQIGRFGIGKLATYVLANRLTHICKSGSRYFSTSMDFGEVPTDETLGIYDEKKINLPLRELTEAEAKEALAPWLQGSPKTPNPTALFGKGAPKSWVVAILSDLKEMATEIQLGRLRWVLQTAMPLRPDFRLYLNSEEIQPSKLTAKRVGRWVLGKDLEKLPGPAPDDLTPDEDEHENKDSIHRYGLKDPVLGRITGFVEVYEDPLAGGKSDEIERSNGFFLYVMGRLVNVDDPGFGINRNLLRHGTFSRFRMVAHIDSLDEVLRSSRETFSKGILYTRAQNLLHGAFNRARVKLEEHEVEVSPGAQMASRLAAIPGSLTRRPLVGLVATAIEGKSHPTLIRYPLDLPPEKQAVFVENLHTRAASPEGLVREAQLVELSIEQRIAVFDVENGMLQINTLHPFVAHFLDEFENKKQSLPLELLAMSEVLMEAHLYEQGLDEDVVRDVMARRDELLRYLARSTGKRTAHMVAQDLIDASTDKQKLEGELVTAFDTMGFDAVPLGGSNRADGKADAHLAAANPGQEKRYAVSLEAKSKEKVGKKVSADRVNISAVARHRDELKCDHALVAGPDFPTQKGERAALVKEIEADREQTKRTITLIRIVDLARLVRLVPLKRVGLDRIRELFETCRTPDECKAWIEQLEKEEVSKVPYRDILETIWRLQNERPSEPVEYAGVAVALDRDKKIRLTKEDLKNICQALSRMAPTMVSAREMSVEMSQRPDKVVETLRVVIQQYPDEERLAFHA